MDVVRMLKDMDISYLARAALCDAGNIKKARKYISKALEKQMNGEGYSFIELLSPCPTNWNMDPGVAAAYIKETILPVFPTGEFIG